MAIAFIITVLYIKPNTTLNSRFNSIFVKRMISRHYRSARLPIIYSLSILSVIIKAFS